jgi:flagellar biosynthesis GTPase FlhF
MAGGWIYFLVVSLFTYFVKPVGFTKLTSGEPTPTFTTMPPRRKNDPKSKPSPPKERKAGRPDHWEPDEEDFIEYDSESDSSWHESDEAPKKSAKRRPKSESETETETESEEERPRRKAEPRRRAESPRRKSEPRRRRYADSEEESPRRRRRTTESDESPRRRRRATEYEESPRRRRRKEETESEEESEDEDEDESEDEDDEEEEMEEPTHGTIELRIADFANEEYVPPKPKKYKLSKEPENVRRFVKLVQADVDPNEEDIDRDIGYFKGLSPASQDKLLSKLRNKVEPVIATIPLKFQIMAKDAPAEIERVAMGKYQALMNIDPSSTEYYKANQWLQGYTQLPLGVFKDLPVRIEDGTGPCQEFVASVRQNMDTAIYGHDDAKLQILQFVSSWIANPTSAGNVLSIHGPPGVGKTTLIKDGVAKALGRPFHFITLGGATDASFLDGHSYTYEGSTWGRIVDVLIKSKCMNPVIYFDELDKVSETPKGEEINNLLIHLTDGSQNDRFQDKYFTGIDLNLSRCLFIFSHNNHEKVNPILRDRMYNIQVAGFGMKEKLVIAEQYLVSSAMREVNLFEKISIGKDLLTYIIDEFTGDEKGVRELKRCIQTVISKLNLLRFYNDPDKVPFSIKGFALPFTLKKEHIGLFLKKKGGLDPSIAHLYT